MTTLLRRAFLAAVPPPAVLDVIDEVFDRTRRSPFRWTRRDQWHITIQYFGKVADCDALIGALAGAVAATPSPAVQLCGAGAFPLARKASVMWLGVADPEPLATVHEAVMDSAGAFVRSRDRVPFIPHVTLARLPSRKNITKEVEPLAGVPIGPRWRVEELVLIESISARGGATYSEIARLRLA